MVFIVSLGFVSIVDSAASHRLANQNKSISVSMNLLFEKCSLQINVYCRQMVLIAGLYCPPTRSSR
jgi:hypothetical protein